MKVIFGLGNPGAEFEKSRHNFGFFFANFLAEKFGGKWNFAKKFDAEICEISINSEKILLAKSQTFYNESGISARKILDFYKIPRENFLVIHDEMDLPIGKIRTRKSGENAGNNGVKSLIQNLGTENFSRIRVGSGIQKNAKNNENPDEKSAKNSGENSENIFAKNGNSKPEKSRQIAHVLGKISRNEREILEKETEIVREIVENFAKNEFAETTFSV